MKDFKEAAFDMVLLIVMSLILIRLSANLQPTVKWPLVIIGCFIVIPFCIEYSKKFWRKGDGQ